MEENVEKDMTPILLEDLGMRFPTEKSKKKKRFGLYQCQYCNTKWETEIQSIKNGYTKSCGCQSPRHSNNHSFSRLNIYGTWKNMNDRCNNPKNKRYEDYGGRGIKVCERWLDVQSFVEDMYPSWEEGLTLDRIDNNGNYEPDNCRWVPNNIQARNTRDITKVNTSGYRGVSWHKRDKRWMVQIKVNNKHINLGSFKTALEGAKAYERYVRLNNLEHNFTPALSEEEIEALNETQN